MEGSVQHGRDPVEVRDTTREDGLLEQVRARSPGGRTACSVLLECHRGALYRRCLQRLGTVHDAEDALQETLLRALQGIHGFEGRSGLRAWLFAIADNECNSLVQRRNRHHYTEHLRHLIQIHEENQQMLATVDQEQTRHVHETLMRLPHTAREVLGLRFFREASLDEIARTLGISLSAAKMRLYRALDSFAAHYPDACVTDAAVDRRLETAA